jgi:hypothetical protein
VSHVLESNDPVDCDLTVTGGTARYRLSRIPGIAADIDVAVLPLTSEVIPVLPVVPSLDGVLFSQDMYFLGYPYGLALQVGGIDRLPFVKKCTLSAMYQSMSGVNNLLRDGFDNLGFSGGSVVFVNMQSNEIQIAGVISAYKAERTAVGFSTPSAQSQATVSLNTGIIVATDIKCAIDAIKLHQSTT